MDKNNEFNKDPDNVYLNVTINHDPNYGTMGSPAVYNVTKTIPILDKCSDYYCSIIRFDIPLDTIPLYRFPIIPNQGNPNLSPLIIGIRSGNVNFPQNLIYVPEHAFHVPSEVQYYFVYTYQNLINSLNTALAAAFIAAASPGGGAPNHAPYFYFDPVTQLIKLIVHTSFIATGSTIYANVEMSNYLSSFPGTLLGFNQPQGRDLEFLFNQTGTQNGNGLVVPYVPFTMNAGDLMFSQEYNTINYWSNLRKILITSNTIPIRTEYLSSKDPTSPLPSSIPILTDFIPALEIAGQSRSISYYYPPGQYRLVDMTGDTPLQNIEMKIYWEDKLGNIYPLTLSIYQQANIKIGFFRKSLYKGSYLLKQ